MTSTVRDFLESSPAARTVAALDLGAGRAVSIWENHDDRVSYDAPRGHVFSLYLDGGTGTRRVDAGSETGWPGSVCIMPDGQTSEWEITTPFRFVHLYLADDFLRAAFAITHDCDARQLDLPEATFAEMPSLVPPLSVLSQAAWSGDILSADAALADLVGHLGRGPVTLRGGLSPHVLRRAEDWIEAHLDHAIRLADLAQLVDLSPFHFHRMFRASKGMTLQAWITRRRIDRARTMLETPGQLIEVAMACGFSSQSHFTRTFKSLTGLTPAAYRAALCSRSILGGKGPRPMNLRARSTSSRT